MAVHNAEIADIFEEIADLLEIQGENPFRVRAYRNGARTLRDLSSDISGMLDKNAELPKLPNIGKDLGTKIKEIVQTGTTEKLESLRKSLPPGLVQLLKLPHVGPKRVKLLYQELDIKTVEDLYQAARSGRIRDIPGFGEKTELQILKAVEAHADKGAKRFLLAGASQTADRLLTRLRQVPGVKQVVAAGSLRRAKETVGDLDVLATAEMSSPIMQSFTGDDDVSEVVSHGPTRSTVILRGGLQVDLRVVEDRSFGAALHYFTGSKAHNIAVRRLGQQRGLKINEYGVFKGQVRVAGDTEESVFQAVGLPYIPPELREDRGEIEAAYAGLLPKLVELGDIVGELHCHTRESDGHASIHEMAEAARARGLKYLAITDHSQSLTVAHGMDTQRLLRQMEQIDRVNAELTGITVLKGVEVDILENGRLDLPDEVLGRLDLVIGAVHSHFDLPRAKQMQRLMRAMDHPHFTLLAHPTGRLLEQRPTIEVNMLRLVRHARERGCFLELNCHPARLDLPDVYCQMAREEGVPVSIDTDAHSTADFDRLRLGIGQGRRGWLTKQDVLNTRSLDELRPLLARTM
jgi:DNA polymerase (family 10)